MLRSISFIHLSLIYYIPQTKLINWVHFMFMYVCCSWRPKWKYYHWSAALVGFLACVAMNFVIVWYWAVVAIVVLIGIYVYIDFRQVISHISIYEYKSHVFRALMFY